MNKNIYITITAGRTGTGYIQKIFELFPDFVSKHEPPPRFDSVIEQNINNNNIGKNIWIKKLKIISSYKEHNYFESSHLICKGFIEPLLLLEIKPNIIILTRNKRDIAKSMLALNTIPGKSKTANRYYLQPSFPNVLKVKNTSNLNDYQLCYWHCLEIERRQRYYKKLFTEINCKVFTTSVNKIVNNGLKEITSFFNITINNNVLQKFEKIKNERVNTKHLGKKKLIYSNIQLEKFEKDLKNDIISTCN